MPFGVCPLSLVASVRTDHISDPPALAIQRHCSCLVFAFPELCCGCGLIAVSRGNCSAPRAPLAGEATKLRTRKEEPNVRGTLGTGSNDTKTCMAKGT